MKIAFTRGIHLAKVAFALSVLTLLSACNDKPGTETASPPAADTPAPPAAEDTGFSVSDAAANLAFAKDQYLKMLGHVENNEHLYFVPGCKKPDAICFPRAFEHEKIYMEELTKWTNGFWPGVFWKMLAVKDQIPGFTDAEKAKMLEAAMFYTEALATEAHRKSTHDLGFLLYDSYGEALEYGDLDPAKRALYTQALVDGRNSLATRYSDEKGLIRSWDWTPVMFSYQPGEGGEIVRERIPLENPWTYPVIVDNMMNLEFLLTSDDPTHHNMAYSHAAKTLENHYHYLDDDPEQTYPIAYHVVDYGTMRPGNWQGMGNISAWARGQGWSFYGFVSVAEFAKKAKIDLSAMPDFLAFSDTLFGSVSHLLAPDPVPMWDFLADEENAIARAENMSTDTAIYAHHLTLCADAIPRETLPYVGYRPMTIEPDLLFADDTIAAMQSMKSVTGEPLIIDGMIKPCGTKPYDLSGRSIPKDTSAATLIAAGLYRFAQFTDDKEKKSAYIALGDRIMEELTKNYLTSKNKGKTYETGFVVEEATGNLPSASEINTPIVYGDFYFIEANVRKLQLAAE